MIIGLYHFSLKRVNNGKYIITGKDGRFTFERIHNTKEQIYFYERAENHKAKEQSFKSLK